jgi:HK97 family phage portal protein
VSRWTAPLRALAERPSRTVDNRSPVPLASRTQSRSMFSYAPTEEIMTYLMQYGSDPVIRPIVARLFQGVSQTTWHLYRKSTTGDPQDRVEVTKHAVLDLIAKPNSFQTFGEIMGRGQQHWELCGEVSIVLGFSAGIKYPIDMWVLRPDRISPVPDAYDFLKGWIYKAPGDSERIPLETRELLRMVDPDPCDPYRGMGAVQALLRDLDASKYTKEWQANFFANSAQPGGMITVPTSLSDPEFDKMTKRWNEQHKGVSKAHRVAILENATWTPNAFSLKDLQMAELESLGRDKTLAAFGMPKSMIGVVEDVNRANAEAGQYMFASEMIKPRLVNWRQMLNKQLLPLFDPTGQLELDFDDPVPENSEANIAERKTNFDVLIAAVAAGFDKSEITEYLDLPDFEYVKPEVPAFGQDGSQAALEGVTAPIQTPDTSPRGAGQPAIDGAMRWVVRGHPDSSCCEPCLKKIGTLYRNRQQAQKDYPPGQGYVNCVGAQFGNHCRCSVVKRRSQRDE